MNVNFVSKQTGLFSKEIQQAQMSDVIDWVSSKGAFCLDTETTGLDPHTNKVILLQVGDRTKQFVIDTRTTDISPLKPYLMSQNVLKIGTNIGFDYKMLRGTFGIIIEKVWDISRTDEVLFNGVFSELHPNPERHKALYGKVFSLAGLCKRHLNLTLDKEVRNSFINKPDDEAFTEKEILYAAKDVIYPEMIRDIQLNLIKVYHLTNCVHLENEVVLAVADMEYNGIQLDVPRWSELAQKQEEILKSQLKILDDYVLNHYKLEKYRTKYKQGDLFQDVEVPDTTIDWRSAQQVLKVLHECNIRVEDTNKKTLEPFAKSLDFVAKLMRVRELIKSVDSYGFAFLKNINPVTNRIHPNFKQLFPDTGRMSCENPNLQNIKKGSSYRECFIADEGSSFLVSDYSNQELRIIADQSQDEIWLEVFRRNGDLHGELAKKLFDIKEEHLQTPIPGGNGVSTYRDIQKNIDFMLAYGGSEYKMSEYTGLPIELCRKLINKFFALVPRVEKYLTESGRFATKNGYSRTPAPIARIRWYRKFGDLHLLDNREKNILLGDIERAGKNTPIQGAGADMMKLAMVKVRCWIRDNNMWDTVKMVLQVHDELVINVKDESIEMFKPVLQKLMIEAGRVIVDSIPMASSCKVSKKWSK